jgi:hypothetical protein
MEAIMERRIFITALSALAVTSEAAIAAAQGTDKQRAIQQLKEWADELEQHGTLTQEELDALQSLEREIRRREAINGFRPCDIKTLMVAAEAGLRAWYGYLASHRKGAACLRV